MKMGGWVGWDFAIHKVRCPSRRHNFDEHKTRDTKGVHLLVAVAMAIDDKSLLFLPRISLLLAVIAVAVMLIPHAEPPLPAATREDNFGRTPTEGKTFTKPKVTSHPDLPIPDDDRMEPIDSYLNQFGIGPGLPELDVWYDNLKVRDKTKSLFVTPCAHLCSPSLARSSLRAWT